MPLPCLIFRPLSRTATLALLSASLLAGTPGLPVARAASRTPGSSGLYGDFLAAQFATAQADPAAASDAYLRALEQSPDQPDLLRRAFLASMLAGRSEAMGLARLLPGDRTAQLLLADAAARSGDWAGVEARARALPRDGLTEVLRPLLIAWSEQARGRTDDALAGLRKLAEAGPFRAMFALHAGLIADLAGREPEAAKSFTVAESAVDAPSLRLAEMLASFDARHGHQGAAMRVLARAADTAPEVGLVLPRLSAAAARPAIRGAADGIAEAYLAAAGSLRLQDQGQASLLLLRLALDLRPDFSAARLLAADLLELRHEPPAARALLEGIGEKDPLSPLARLHLAGLMQRQGDLTGAIGELDALARDCPQSPLPLAEKAGLLRGKGRYAEAVAVYDQAIARVPAQPEAADWALFYERGVARDQAHDWAGGEADLQHALALSPDQAMVLNYLGYSWAEKGEHLTEARRMIEKAVQAEPTDGAIVDSLGWVMLRQGDVAGAVPTLERASELMPDDATVNGHLGDAYAAAGRRLEAGYQWRRALMLHPEPEEAEKLRTKLDEAPRQAAVMVPKE